MSTHLSQITSVCKPFPSYACRKLVGEFRYLLNGRKHIEAFFVNSTCLPIDPETRDRMQHHFDEQYLYRHGTLVLLGAHDITYTHQLGAGHVQLVRG